jgi:hypothetical protein
MEHRSGTIRYRSNTTRHTRGDLEATRRESKSQLAAAEAKPTRGGNQRGQVETAEVRWIRVLGGVPPTVRGRG